MRRAVIPMVKSRTSLRDFGMPKFCCHSVATPEGDSGVLRGILGFGALAQNDRKSSEVPSS
jgi:hypothetical protein